MGSPDISSKLVRPARWVDLDLHQTERTVPGLVVYGINEELSRNNNGICMQTEFLSCWYVCEGLSSCKSILNREELVKHAFHCIGDDPERSATANHNMLLVHGMCDAYYDPTRTQLHLRLCHLQMKVCYVAQVPLEPQGGGYCESRFASAGVRHSCVGTALHPHQSEHRLEARPRVGGRELKTRKHVLQILIATQLAPSSLVCSPHSSSVHAGSTTSQTPSRTCRPSLRHPSSPSGR